MDVAVLSLVSGLRETGRSFATLAPFWQLLKPRVVQLVVFTALCTVPFVSSTVDIFVCLVTLLCIALGSGAAGAFNMWYDRDIDAHMQRTSGRPIPSGQVSAGDALCFSIVLASFSVCLLGLAVDWNAAFWLAFSIFFYAVVYTIFLKRYTVQNIVIGGAAGAFPPVIMWAALQGNVSELMPWSLFLIVFFWTPPHFWALALYRSDDYRRVGVPMLPVVKGRATTVTNIIFYTLVLVGVSFMPVLIQQSTVAYAAFALYLGVRFLRLANKLLGGDIDSQNIVAKQMFVYSIFYLFAIFGLLVVDKLVFSVIITRFF